MMTHEIPDLSPERRLFFYRHIEVVGKCWVWKGHYNGGHRGGYGLLYIDGKRYLTHRVSYWLHSGVQPGNSLVLHTCHNRRCVNPHHLKLGDNFENGVDMVRAGRSPQAKLRWDQIPGIRELAEQGVKGVEIARQFQVSPSVISKILSGTAWKGA